MKHPINRIRVSDQLPSLPQIAVRAIEWAQRDEPDFPEIVAAIKADPAMSAKLLKTANSALFGFRSRVSSIDAAVPALGANLVRTLVLSFALARHRSPLPVLDNAYQSVWRRSLTQAVVAETLTSGTDSCDSDVFFTAGLLQDIGMLALLCEHAEQYAQLFLDFRNSSDLCEAEQHRFGFTHVDVGVELCRRWRFEDELVDAIAHHHASPAELDSKSVSTMSVALMAASQCADYIEQIRQGKPPAQPPSLLTDFYILSGCDIADLVRDVDLRVGEIAAMFSFDVGRLPNAEEIYLRAKSALEKIAIQSQVEVVAARKEAEQARIKQQHLEAEKELLASQVYRDALTGAYNRSFMSSQLESELRKRLSRGLAVGFLFLDIDQFKGLNDTHGHDVGDQILAKVSDVLHRSVRKSDVVIRYGGDEFVVVLMDEAITELKVEKVARRICRRVNKTRLPSKKCIRITGSVGSVFYVPQADLPLGSDQLIGKADQAMYEAKSQGGNQVRLYCLPEKNSTVPAASNAPSLRRSHVGRFERVEESETAEACEA